jgi:hypothetical protein
MATDLDDLFGRTGNLAGSTATVGGVWSRITNGFVANTPTLNGDVVTFDINDPNFFVNSVAQTGNQSQVTLYFTPYDDNWQAAVHLRVQADGFTCYQLLFGPGAGVLSKRTSASDTWHGGTTIGSTATNVSLPASHRSEITLVFAVSSAGVLTASVNGTSLNFGSPPAEGSPLGVGNYGIGGRAHSATRAHGEGSTGGSTPVAFTGTVPAINATVGTAGSVDLASYFSGSLTPFTYSTFAGTLPTGFSRSGSVISWTTGTTAGTTTGIQIRATDTGTNVATTNAFSIVVAAAPAAPTINTHPSNQTVSAPAAATFTVSASGTGLTYQWQRNPGGVGSFADIGAATSTGYTTGATAVTGGSHNNGDTYRVVVSNGGGSVTSNAATLTVNSASGTLTLTSPLTNNTGPNSGTWASQTGVTLTILNVSTKASVLVVTGRATNASGVLTSAVTDAAIVTGQTYRIVPWLGTEAGISQVLTAT